MTAVTLWPTGNTLVRLDGPHGTLVSPWPTGNTLISLDGPHGTLVSLQGTHFVSHIDAK